VLTKPAGCFLQLVGGGVLLIAMALLLGNGWSVGRVLLALLGLGIMFLGGLPAIQKK
jgi:hypothetical protein